MASSLRAGGCVINHQNLHQNVQLVVHPQWTQSLESEAYVVSNQWIQSLETEAYIYHNAGRTNKVRANPAVPLAS